MSLIHEEKVSPTVLLGFDTVTMKGMKRIFIYDFKEDKESTKFLFILAK